MKIKNLLFLSAAIWMASYANAQAPLHVVVHDGPYVRYAGGKVYVSTILNDHGKYTVRTDSVAEAMKSSVVLQLPGGVAGQFLNFSLKKEIDREKAEYKKVSRQFIVSDIEGNYAAFQKLLQAGGVIDSQGNWTFADGHLVLVGDFVDRGEQQTEVLWLIYALEEKAKAAGGYVHFVLGNHEIMNLSGDLRYLNPKYNEVSALLGSSYMQLLGEDTELGRWLRSKNIMEKVGDVLYAHGGVSPDVVNLDLSLKQINEMARPFYADSSYNFRDSRVGVLYTDNGPFWYRGYYSSPRASQQDIKQALDHLNARYIVTGHTVVDKVITSWYEGKVINADVPHATGNSEAVLFENGVFTRIDANGTRHPLLKK